MKSTTVLLYEVSHVERFLQLRPTLPEPLCVIALGADVEFALEKHSVPFSSARGLRSVTPVERILHGEELGRKIYADPTFSFFSHAGIGLGPLLTMDLQWYVTLLAYYVDIYVSAFEQRDTGRVVTFATDIVLRDTAGIVAPFEAHVVADALQLVCTTFAIPCEVRAGKSGPKPLQRWLFSLERRVLGWGMSAINAAQTVWPRKNIRILASEYWKNIAPLVGELREGELFLLDRGEVLKAGVGAIWKHRMRFTGVEQYITRRVKKIAARKADFFVTEWARVKADNTFLRNASFRGVSLAPLLQKVLQHAVSEGGEKSVQTIEAVSDMCKQICPDVVLVRASASQQIHFAILCHVARSQGIPSLEIQHGVRYVGPGSFSKHHAAEYMAVYGPAVRTQMKTAGYTDQTLFDVGSPRFDAYPRIPQPHDGLTVACVGPSLVPGFWEDTYDGADYLTAMAEAVRNTGAKVLLKLRPGRSYVDFYSTLIKKSFAGIQYRVCRDEPLSDVYAASDIVISPYSTAMLEALLMYKPTIFFASLPAYEAFGGEFTAYEGDALRLARTGEELTKQVAILAGDTEERERMATRARTCIERNYVFDGKSSARLAGVVRMLATSAPRTHPHV